VVCRRNWTRLSCTIIIDATRQLPDEGGSVQWPLFNRDLLRKAYPDLLQRVDAQELKWLSCWRVLPDTSSTCPRFRIRGADRFR